MSLSNIGLDAFIAISKYQTVLEASKHLGITQTAVTQRLKSLETDLGSTLFIRSRKGMKLTDSGIKLLTYSKQKDSMESEVVSSILNEGVSRPIRISISGSTYFVNKRVLPLITEVKKSFPQIYFNFDISDNDDKIAKLKNGIVDFTFLPRDKVALEFDSKLLKKSRYILVGGTKYKNKLDNPTLIDYSPVDNFTSHFFNEHSIDYNKAKERHYLNNTLMLPQVLEQNLGVAVLDSEHFKDCKNQYQIYNLYPKKFYEVQWALVWLSRVQVPKYFKEIIHLIK